MQLSFSIQYIFVVYSLYYFLRLEILDFASKNSHCVSDCLKKVDFLCYVNDEEESSV